MVVLSFVPLPGMYVCNKKDDLFTLILLMTGLLTKIVVASASFEVLH